MASRRNGAPRRAARGKPGTLKRIYRRWRSGRQVLSVESWNKALQTSAYASALPANERARLRQIATRLLRDKSMEGALGFRLNEHMRARIALHAALPILHLGIDYYAGWSSFVVYPGDFRVHDEYMDEHGVVHREIMDLCGQSLSEGPIVLSWESLREEDATPGDHDLVIHECAHKLDLLNGVANGYPPLHPDMDARAWARDFHDAYRRLCEGLDREDGGGIDPYAAEDPAEFFAVLSETFFTAPQLVYREHPDVYKQLQQFYRQDPVSIMTGADR